MVNSSSPEDNIFRDTVLRYCGYANEVGESFRYQYPRFVTPSYLLSACYCLADAGTTGLSRYNTSKDNELALKLSAIATLDTLVWQLLASVLIPGATINTIVRLSKFGVDQMNLGATAKKWVPTGIGLLSIPLIIKPIDQAVDYMMDETFRPYVRARYK